MAIHKNKFWKDKYTLSYIYTQIPQKKNNSARRLSLLLCLRRFIPAPSLEIVDSLAAPPCSSAVPFRRCHPAVLHLCNSISTPPSSRFFPVLHLCNSILISILHLKLHLPLQFDFDFDFALEISILISIAIEVFFLISIAIELFLFPVFLPWDFDFGVLKTGRTSFGLLKARFFYFYQSVWLSFAPDFDFTGKNEFWSIKNGILLEHELQSVVLTLYPKVCFQNGSPKPVFLTYQDDVLCRVNIAKFFGAFVGEFVIEDVQIGSNSDSNKILRRRLRFKITPNLIQS